MIPDGVGLEAHDPTLRFLSRHAVAHDEDWLYQRLPSGRMDVGPEQGLASIGSDPASRIRAACSRIRLGVTGLVRRSIHSPSVCDKMVAKFREGVLLFVLVSNMPMLDAPSQLEIEAQAVT